MRARHRLHLAGLDADQVVPRPAGHGDRHGDHGLRRRRLHRLAAVGVADEQVFHRDAMSASPRPSSCWAAIYFCLHDGRRGHRARAGAGLEAGRLCRRRRRRTKLITTNDVFVYDALKTPQFWLIWWVLCLNVTAGIGVLGQASAMSQEMFPGHITAVAAAGFVGLMSLFNMGGRFFWASTSDYIGRKNTYFVFFVLGFVLYASCPTPARSAASRCSCSASWSSSACMAAASPPCRPICGHVRHALCRRHPRPAADGLVDGRHLRPGAGQLHPRVQRHARRAEGAGLQHHDVHHGRAAGDRLHLQLPASRPSTPAST